MGKACEQQKPGTTTSSHCLLDTYACAVQSHMKLGDWMQDNMLASSRCNSLRCSSSPQLTGSSNSSGIATVDSISSFLLSNLTAKYVTKSHSSGKPLSPADASSPAMAGPLALLVVEGRSGAPDAEVAAAPVLAACLVVKATARPLTVLMMTE